MRTALFDFKLPPERIAVHPVKPRDAARLLTVTAGAMEDRVVTDLPSLLHPGDVMVFNDTRVVPVRLTGYRGTAKVEVTLHKPVNDKIWRAFLRPGKRVRVGDVILFSNALSAEVAAKHESGEVDLKWLNNDWRRQVDECGQMPLPHYMKRESEVADKESYQTVYAQKDGAVAAPTAGLHFTEELLSRLDKSGIKRAVVTLHVGAGTFQPVKADDTDEHIMHTEYIEISAETAGLINKTREDGGRVIAVGTTSLRVLESVADENGRLKPFTGETGIFITPGYRFKVTDILMTNFHLPRSTLFILVSAFMGLERMKEVYQHAIEANYRFYSYGDASLLIR
jgi:S-adenosylmethionine:tRNA ribosyltransferase-isomerase